MAATRAYEPYGQVRGRTGSLDTDRGFVGQIEDRTTSLSYLGARYYDATIGGFISPDPLFDTSRPKTLNPYTYAAGNPVTMSDPTGTSPSYIFGLETENAALRQTVSDLQGIITRSSSAWSSTSTSWKASSANNNGSSEPSRPTSATCSTS